MIGINARTVATAVLILSPLAQANAYECRERFWCNCEWPTGTSATYSFDPSATINRPAMTFSELIGIVRGDIGWDMGPQSDARGSSWGFTIGPNRPLVMGDGFNGIAFGSEQEFQNAGMGDALGLTFYAGSSFPSCGIQEFDILIRDFDNQTVLSWLDKPLSELDADQPYDSGADLSLRAVALHEFGHASGFNHETDFQTVMNETYPFFGGDQSSSTITRLHEDEADGLRDGKPDGSTGHNLSLARFHNDDSAESWTRNDFIRLDGVIFPGPEVLCQGGSYQNGDLSNAPGGGIIVLPSPITLNKFGPGSSGQFRLRHYWQPGTYDLSTNTFTATAACPSGSKMWRSIVYNGLTMGAPTTSNPPVWAVPQSTTPGMYRACAVIDPINQVTETNENDNIVFSEQVVEVRASGDPTCP